MSLLYRVTRWLDSDQAIVATIVLVLLTHGL